MWVDFYGFGMIFGMFVYLWVRKLWYGMFYWLLMMLLGMVLKYCFRSVVIVYLFCFLLLLGYLMLF